MEHFYRMRDAYKDAFSSFIKDVNSMRNVEIHMGKALTKKGVGNLADDDKGQYLIIEFKGPEPAALAITAPPLDPGKKERTLAPKTIKQVEGISLIRFEDKNRSVPAHKPDAKLDRGMRLVASRLMNQMSYSPLFEPVEGDDAERMRPSVYSVDLTRQPHNDPANFCFRRILDDDVDGDGRHGIDADRAKIMLGLEKENKNRSVEAMKPMLRLAAWTKGLDSGGEFPELAAAMGSLEGNGGARHMLGLDALGDVLGNIDRAISDAGPDGDIEYERLLEPLERDGSDAVAGLCALAVYRRCDAYADLSGKRTKSFGSDAYRKLDLASLMNRREYDMACLKAEYDYSVGNAEICFPKYMLEGKTNDAVHTKYDAYRQYRAELIGNGATAYGPGIVSDTCYYAVKSQDKRGKEIICVRKGDPSDAASEMPFDAFVKTEEFRENFPVLKGLLGEESKKYGNMAVKYVAGALGTKESCDMLTAECAGFDGTAAKFREYSLTELAVLDMVGTPDEGSGWSKFGWLSEKACAKPPEGASPILRQEIMLRTFDPKNDAYAACEKCLRKLFEEHETAAGSERVEKSAKLNDFLVMMDVYRPDTADGIKDLMSDIEKAHNGIFTKRSLYRPSSSAEARLLKDLAGSGASMDAFRGIGNGDGAGFAEAVRATIESDVAVSGSEISSAIDADKLLGGMVTEAMGKDTVLHRGASDLIGVIESAVDAREENRLKAVEECERRLSEAAEAKRNMAAAMPSSGNVEAKTLAFDK